MSLLGFRVKSSFVFDGGVRSVPEILISLLCGGV
jgi:hypothetical protein